MDGMIYDLTAGQIFTATKAATAEINPSMTKGIFNAAPPINTPTSPAISSPPTLLSTSIGSSFFGLLISIAFFIAFIF